MQMQDLPQSENVEDRRGEPFLNHLMWLMNPQNTFSQAIEDLKNPFSIPSRFKNQVPDEAYYNPMSYDAGLADITKRSPLELLMYGSARR